MSGVYNKEALNRIASEDRLDRAIVLVSPGVWISILGAFIIIGILVIWGFKGSLPYSVDTEGIYMENDGATAVYSQTDGFVVDIKVSEGEVIEVGDLICTLGTEDDIFQLQQLDRRIQYVENMTFESEADVVTSDTEQMAQIKLNAKKNDQTAEQTKANLELKEEKLADAKQDVEDKEALLVAYKEKYFATLNVADNQDQLAYQEAESDYDTHFSMYQTAKNNYISATESYYEAKAAFDGKYAEWDINDHTDQENMAYESELADLEDMRSRSEDYKYLMEQEEKDLKDYNSSLESARKEYLEYLNEQSGVAGENTIASTEYSEALQEYTAAKNIYNSLLDEVDQLKLQQIFDEGNADIDADTLKQQFQNQKSATLSDLQNQREVVLNNAAKSEIRATVSGRIYEIDTAVGRAVSRGSEILDLYYGGLEIDPVILYVKLSDARRLKSGMDVYVFPSTVNKQEYGHIEGKISSVSDHAADMTNMVEQLGSQSLADDFRKAGTVVEVRCTLARDNTTASGYSWSTDKGDKVTLDSGTLVTATVVTEYKRPIDLFIPYIKEKLDFDIDEDEAV
ncbi:MAG: HlyD family efflux transporter periplasmic adaptor subunit [Lachnospiraceae bacterium]|nr:HlyD family efflux transporter periplasmic adaptor subunit [Lachnospiraceae bacterium]